MPDINKHEVDIENLFKQNANDLSAIKELYRKLKEMEEKITQIKYIDSSLAKKLKKEYENLKRIILDENVQLQLIDKINQSKAELIKNINEVNAQIDNNMNEVNSQLETKANKNEIGSPLAVSTISEMIDKTKVYVNTTDGKWYSWNGNEWTIGGVYNSQGIGDNSIDPAKTTFFEQKGENLFKDKTYLDGKIYINGSYLTGESYTSYCASQKNHVKELSSYNINNGVKKIVAQAISFLDSSEKYISQITGGASEFKTPSGCSYVVLSFTREDVPTFSNLYIQSGNNISPVKYLFTGNLKEKCIKVSNLDIELQNKINNIGDQQTSNIQGVVDEFKNKKALIGKYLNPETNILTDNEQFATSETIEALPNQEYIFDRNDYKINQSGSTTFFDAEGNHLGGIYSYESFTTPANCASFRVSIYQATQEDFNNLILIKGNKLKPLSKPRTATIFENKKWTVIGDSWTEKNYRTSLNYHDYVASELGFNVVNLGIGGTGYKNRDSEGNMAFYQRMDAIPLDTDIITILGGENDCLFATSTPVGEITDNDNTTLCGCVNLTIDAIYNRLPFARLGIITPGGSESFNPMNDNKMEQFVTKIIEICKKRKIPCLDLYHTCNLRPWVTEVNAKLFSCGDSPDGDGLHPNHIGHRDYISPEVREFVKTL